MPVSLVPLGGMRWIVCGIVGTFLWGQGSDPLRDSLLVENERIEYLELGTKPYLPVMSFEMPKWDIKVAPEWDKGPTVSLTLPQAVGPTRPTWPRLDPIHFRYSMGRYWTQEVQFLWNQTRDLTRDAGIRLHHRSTPQGHLPQARWGITTLTGWGGYYHTRIAVEGRYEGNYQLYRLYAPYAERWEGFDQTAPLPDSLRVSYFRQQGEIMLRSPARQRYLRYWTGRTDFRTGVPEWLHVLSAGITLPLPFPGEGEIRGEAFGDGQRYAVSARPLYRYQGREWEVEAGLQLSYARTPRNSLLLLSPVGTATYKGWSPLLRPYVKADASIRPVSYFYQLERNPYLRRVSEAPPFEQTWTATEIGIKGQGSGWDYRLAAEYTLQEGVPLFVPQGATFRIDTLRRFQSTGILLQALYMPAPTGTYTELRFVARQWKIRSLYTAFYGEAPIEGALRLGYRIREKWHIRGAVTVLGPRRLDEQTQAPIFVDISWRVERQILPILSFFVEMNNLLNQRFYRWRGYQERPLDFCLGIWTKIG